MKSNSYLKESVESYLLVFSMSLIFFGGIILVGEATGNDWSGLLPNLSWDMINTWSEIMDSNS